MSGGRALAEYAARLRAERQAREAALGRRILAAVESDGAMLVDVANAYAISPSIASQLLRRARRERDARRNERKKETDT